MNAPDRHKREFLSTQHEVTALSAPALLQFDSQVASITGGPRSRASVGTLRCTDSPGPMHRNAMAGIAFDRHTQRP